MDGMHKYVIPDQIFSIKRPLSVTIGGVIMSQPFK